MPLDSTVEPLSLAHAFARQTGFRTARALSRDNAGPAVLSRIHGRKQDAPVLLGGFAADWPALKRWDGAYIVSQWGDVRVSTALGLPAHGVPFLVPASDFRRELSVRAFWKELERTRCWLDEQACSLFPGLEDDLRMEQLMDGRPRFGLNLWVGRGTKSGLHFDPTDNFLVMVRGTKLVAMASSREARRVYPFPGSIMKSQVDVERPDFARFPRAADVEIFVGHLTPGDVLYIPAGWWHYLSAPGDAYQISVSCSFGRELSLPFLAWRLLRLGPRHAARVGNDFLRYGLLSRPCAPRFHDLPNGVQLYRKLRALWWRVGGSPTDDGGAQEVGCSVR